ncbi:solute carrier family 35 member G1 isoform X2 [Otolemur garnettii]|uniref:solute carrier family 35 member G1 isoform X2 n=1 Tax=Otolemur garnettii TaxID=30611 RepID=UPI0006443EAD|nr:solute carrier family 35 member G1 isoform X2 [Otolemur garnettii]
MQPQDNAGASDPGDPGLLLTDYAPPGTSEEPAAAEAAGAPVRSKCCRCCPSPGGSGAEPELGLLAQKIDEFSSFSEESLVLPP